MFRNPPVHPYQATTVPRSAAQFERAVGQRAKYPWLENPSSGDSAAQYAEPQWTPALAPPAVSPVPSEIGAPGGCGGHCPGFEYVCYYVLQIVFVVGILTGVSLCIAGGVLRRSNRGGDLGVLVYIGCLSFMVCGLLLGIQCCVRRGDGRRAERIRPRGARPDCIRLDAIPNPYAGAGAGDVDGDAPGRQLRPLLFPAATSTLPRGHYG